MDDEGWTPLHSAAMEGFGDIVLALLKTRENVEEEPIDVDIALYDEDEKVVENRWRTADDLAEDQGYADIAQAIRGIFSPF